MFLIIRNTFKFRIHFFFYVVMAIALFTGNIIDFLIFTSIIVVHELGHIFGALMFKWDIKEVVILPFGGLTVFNQKINTSLLEQFIVTLLGPLFQIVFFALISNFFSLSKSVIYYNFVLLVFNLLPIFPLDGSKFLFVFLCMIFPFKFSHLLVIFISFCTIVFLFFLVDYFDFLIFLILLFLIIKLVLEFSNHRLIFNKFLFERYSYCFNFKKIKIIKNINSMYLMCKHVFLVDGEYITERNILRKRFDKYNKL